MVSYTKVQKAADLDSLFTQKLSEQEVRDLYKRASLADDEDKQELYIEIAAYPHTPEDILEHLFELKDENILQALVSNTEVTSLMITRVYEVFKDDNYHTSLALLKSIVSSFTPSPVEILKEVIEKYDDIRIINGVAWHPNLTEELIIDLMERSQAEQYYEALACNINSSEKIMVAIYNKISATLDEVEQSNESEFLGYTSFYSTPLYDNCVSAARQIAQNDKTPNWLIEKLATMSCIKGIVILNPKVTLDIIRKIPFEDIDFSVANEIIIRCRKGDEDILDRLIKHKDKDIKVTALSHPLVPIIKVYQEASNSKDLMKAERIRSVSRRSQSRIVRKIDTLRDILLNQRYEEFKACLLEVESVDITGLPKDMVRLLLGWD
jgi:hypothetical protein